MLEVITFILERGIKISLGFAAGLILLRALNMQKLNKCLWRGLAGSSLAGFSWVYPLKYFKLREEFDAIWAFLTLILCLAIFVFTWRAKRFEAGKENKVLPFSGKVLIFTIGFLLPLQDFIDIALFPGDIFITAKSYLTTELILKISGGILGAGISIFLGKIFIRISQFLDKKKALLLVLMMFISIAIRSLIILASGLLLLGLLPATTKTVAVIAPLINYLHLTFYALLFILGFGLLITRIHKENKNNSDTLTLNPARRRKIKAGDLIRKYWINSGYASLAIVTVFIAVNYAWTNRKIELSPAEKTIPQNGLIYIPVESVNDGNLHRFYYAGKEGINIRFIMVKKREGVFGVGFDACEICGSRGYYQRKKGEIVCLACDVVMNLDTIGFPGGCNPIPLAYKKENDFLLIRVSDIEAEKEEFRK